MDTVNIYKLIILDESGMDCIRQNALSGINKTIQGIRSAQKDNPWILQYVSIVTERKLAAA